MAANERLICASGQVEDGGRGVRFEIEAEGETLPAFVVRFRGQVHGFLNRCGHIPVELDWQPGDFFDYSRLHLTCSTHGALYDPASGDCVAGRCNGRGLSPVSVVEREGNIYLKDA